MSTLEPTPLSGSPGATSSVAQRAPGRALRCTTMADELAEFAAGARFDMLSLDTRAALKTRILDALGCALGAVGAPPVEAVRAALEELAGSSRCSLICGGLSAPDRAALYNGALVRYLDFNDAYLAPGETCHPSDNFAPVLAAAEFAHASGRDLMTALAVAYQVQCRLSDVAPVRAHGFDHTTQGAFAVAAGVARALGLDGERTANAIALAGTACPSLRITRGGELSQWKGLAYPYTAHGALLTTLLAAHGITGPRAIFEGPMGLMDVITGPFAIDWKSEPLDRVCRTDLKRYDAEVHSQSVIEGLIELRALGLLDVYDRRGDGERVVERIDLDVFDVAHRIIGGGDGSDKTYVRTKEQADHSLPYLAAVAWLDGEVGKEQYEPERVARADVQALLRRVSVRSDETLSARFPAELPCRIRVYLRDGHVLAKEKHDYEGFHSRPMSWEKVVAKFRKLAEVCLEPAGVETIICRVRNLEDESAADLGEDLRELV